MRLKPATREALWQLLLTSASSSQSESPPNELGDAIGGGSGNSGRRGEHVGEDRPNPAEAESARETNAFCAFVEEGSALLPMIRGGGTETVA